MILWDILSIIDFWVIEQKRLYNPEEKTSHLNNIVCVDSYYQYNFYKLQILIIFNTVVYKVYYTYSCSLKSFIKKISFDQKRKKKSLKQSYIIVIYTIDFNNDLYEYNWAFFWSAIQQLGVLHMT